MCVNLRQDGADTEDAVFIVTERVEPLTEWLISQEGEPEASRAAACCWGLHCIAKALSFINSDCKLIHGNLCRDSVFVTKVSRWASLQAQDFHIAPVSATVVSCVCCGCSPPLRVETGSLRASK